MIMLRYKITSDMLCLRIYYTIIYTVVNDYVTPIINYTNTINKDRKQ